MATRSIEVGGDLTVTSLAFTLLLPPGALAEYRRRSIVWHLAVNSFPYYAYYVPQVVSSKLNLVDLAGSERLKKALDQVSWS